MTPAEARDELTRRALAADRTRLWLASAAHVAVSWRRDVDGAMRAEGPTLAEIAQLERHAVGVDAREFAEVMRLLCSVARDRADGDARSG